MLACTRMLRMLADKYSRVALPPSEEKQKEQKPAESEGNNFANLPLLRELVDFARNVTSHAMFWYSL